MNTTPEFLYLYSLAKEYVTRKQNNFIVQYSKNRVKCMCLSILGVKLCNALDNDLREYNLLVKFKQEESARERALCQLTECF